MLQTIVLLLLQMEQVSHAPASDQHAPGRFQFLSKLRDRLTPVYYWKVHILLVRQVCYLSHQAKPKGESFALFVESVTRFSVSVMTASRPIDTPNICVEIFETASVFS